MGVSTSLFETGLPLHSGRHLKDPYTNFVNSKLERLQSKYDRGLISDNDLIRNVQNVEDSIRKALLDKKIKLQNSDPHF
jgi:hypothetical protein